MNTKVFNVLAVLAVIYISTWSFHDIVSTAFWGVVGGVVGLGLNYLQQHEQIEEQRTAQRAELITRLDRWQQDVKGKATQSGQRRS